MRGAVFGIICLVCLPGCGEDTKSVLPPEGGSTLSEDAQSGCYDWPAEDFSRDNLANLIAGLPAGGPAVAFSLRDGEGTVYELATLLETKPALLVLGSFT